MKHIEWDDIWQTILVIFVLGIILFFLFTIFSEKRVKGYYLDSSQRGIYNIGVDVEWDTDKSVALDKNVTLQEAVTVIDSLNKTIK